MVRNLTITLSVVLVARQREAVCACDCLCGRLGLSLFFGVMWPVMGHKYSTRVDMPSFSTHQLKPSIT